jgi:hypothetical protein
MPHRVSPWWCTLPDTEAEDALLELARQLVGELASGKLLAFALEGRGGSDAGRDLANHRWAKGPGSVIGGRPVQAVMSHPKSPTVLYDLGEGHFAEGADGKTGPVMHSDQFSQQALLGKGWAAQVTPEEPGASPGTGGGRSEPGDGPPPRPSSGRRAAMPGSAGGRDAPPPASDAIAKELAAGSATDEQGTLDGRGQIWHPDRATIHKDIVNEHLAQAVSVPSEGRAVMLAGLGHDKPAALAKAGAFSLDRHAVVSPHQIERELGAAGLVPEIAGQSPESSGPLVQQEASHVASLVASALAARRKNMVLDGSGTNRISDIERIKRLRASGYTHIHGIHVHTPPPVAAGRALEPHAIWSAARSHGTDDASEGFEKLKPHLDGWEKWDHSGAAPVRKQRGGSPPRDGVFSVEDVVAGGH